MWQLWEQAELLALPLRTFFFYDNSIGQKLHSGSPAKRNVRYICNFKKKKKAHLCARSKLVVIMIKSKRYTLTDAEIYSVKP